MKESMKRHVWKVRVLGILGCVVFAVAIPVRAQIVAFGASNVSGWNVAASETFAAQLQTMLRNKGYRVKVINAGVYGSTTADMRNRMDKDIPEGTKIVILDAIGGLFNDSLKGISQAQGEADMAAIQERLKARGIQVIPVVAADLGAEYHQADGVQLNPEGHKLVAQKLLPQVSAILGPPTGPPRSVQEACAADAKRLCADFLGDDEKRHLCMQEHKAELSKDCLRAIAASRQH
jgi:acyl-CoA thioesterase I